MVQHVNNSGKYPSLWYVHSLCITLNIQVTDYSQELDLLNAETHYIFKCSLYGLVLNTFFYGNFCTEYIDVIICNIEEETQSL